MTDGRQDTQDTQDAQDAHEEYDPYDDVADWTEEDEERYQANRQQEFRRRRRRRRQGWSFAVLVLLVLGAGVAGAGIAQGRWEWPFGREEAEAEPQVEPGPDCSAATISLPQDVEVNVLNATDVRGLAAAVATELERRGYTVADVGNEESGVEVLDGVQIRYGPELAADARSAALHFTGVVLVDDDRSGDVVDVVLGQAYRRMGPAEGASAAIAAAAPPGCAPTPAATTPAPTATG